MSYLNKVMIIGNVGLEPESRSLNDGTTVVRLSVATTEKWVDKKTLEKKELSEWHTIELFGKVADNVVRYVKKGSKIYIEGKIKSEKYKDKDGIDRKSLKIIAKDFQILTPRDKDNNETQGSFNNNQVTNTTNESFDDDDIPF
jgi:single-strand DNA-binding protein